MRGDLTSPTEGGRPGLFRLRRLAKDEIGCIELFGLTNSWLEGGLPHVERPPKDLSDDLFEQAKAFFGEMEEMGAQRDVPL